MEAQTSPLSGPQRRALARLSALDGRDEGHWWSTTGIPLRTLRALESRRVVEVRPNWDRVSGQETRITPKGREALR